MIIRHRSHRFRFVWITNCVWFLFLFWLVGGAKQLPTSKSEGVCDGVGFVVAVSIIDQKEQKHLGFVK